MKGSYTELAQHVVEMALKRGATGAECTVSEGTEFSVTVRLGEIESLKEAGSRGVGLRVLSGRRSGSSYTSDFSDEGLDRMVKAAIDIVQITGEDPHAGLPEPSEIGAIDGDLKLYSPSVEALPADDKIRMATEAEAVALGFSPKVGNSEGGSFESHLSTRAFASSTGFSGVYRTSSCSLSVVPVVSDGGAMERDYWFSLARAPELLETPEEVGRRAAERALRRLGARKVPTQKATVVLEPRVARSVLGHIFEAVEGESVYRKASFLAGRLGEQVAADSVTVIDDATLPGLFGTSPFDDEGVPSRRTVVIEHGVLRNYLLNTYTARKLGMKSTGNASRGLAGNAGIGHGNLFLEQGTQTPEEIYRAIGTGLLVTELLGSGVNVVTGDYSRGAAGLWIENGELAYPVSEITIAGNLKRMLMDIEWIGSDLEFRGSTAAPTIAIREMTISGS